jgi:hypothetical protein
MMLCGISIVFNSLGEVLGLMSCKRSSENGQVLVGFQSTEAFGCLHHAGGGPAQRHRGISPSLHVATDAAHGPHHVLNRHISEEAAPAPTWEAFARSPAIALGVNSVCCKRGSVNVRFSSAS